MKVMLVSPITNLSGTCSSCCLPESVSLRISRFFHLRFHRFTCSILCLACLLFSPQNYIKGAHSGARLYCLNMPAEGIVSDSVNIVRLKWINFSPYTKPGQNPNSLTSIPEAQIIELLDSLKPWVEGIRTFGTQQGLENIPYLAKQRGFKVILGIWLGREDTPAGVMANAQQIANGIAIANAGYADRVIVGSEVLLRDDLPATKLVGYINAVKQAIPDSIPVSCADSYHELVCNPEVVAACDFLAPNIYPFWEGIPVKYAIRCFDLAVKCLQTVAAGKEIFVSESGWRTWGQANNGSSTPSLPDAIQYNRELLGWSKAFGIAVNLFSAYDEPWKASDDGWGIFDNKGIMKPGMDTLFRPINQIDSAWLTPIPGFGDTAILVIDYVPLIGSHGFLTGHVNIPDPCGYVISVWIRVNGGWWIKPTYANPTVNIRCDGAWSANYATGGSDVDATDICIFLLPKGFDAPPPPFCGGCVTIPATVYGHALAFSCVHRYKLAAATIAASETLVCPNAPVTLVAKGGTFYQWSTGGQTDTIQVNPQHSQHYSVTISDGMGGASILSILINVHSLNMHVSASPQQICPGDSATLFASGGISYLWDTGETGSTIVVTPWSSTNYRVTMTDSNGCKKIDSIKMYVQEVKGSIYPNANQTSICLGKSINLYGQGGSTYEWSTGQTGYWIKVSPVGDSTYFVTVTSNLGCKDTAKITIMVFDNPAASITVSSNTICRGDSVILGAAGGVQYTWSPGDTLSTIIKWPEYSRTYTVTVTNASGCTATASVTINVQSPPTQYAVTGGGTICFGDPGVPVGLADSQSGIKYQLRVNGTDTGAAVTGSGSAISFGKQTVAGIYTVFAQNLTTGCAGPMSGNAVIVVNPLPVVEITSESPLASCLGDTITLDAGPGYSTYQWTSGATTQTIQVTSSGIYGVEVTSVEGCIAGAAVPAVVTLSPLPVVAINPLDSVYSNLKAGVPLSGIPAGCAFAGHGVSDTFFNPQMAGTGVHTIYCTYTDSLGCTGVDSVTVTVCAAPVAGFVPQITASEVTFVNQSESSGETAQFTWYFGDGNGSTDENPVHQYQSDGIYNVCLVCSTVCDADTICKELTITVVGSATPFGSNRLKTYPNPGSGAVLIEWPDMNAGKAWLEILDPMGRQVRIIQNVGSSPWIWDGNDGSGQPLSPGIYCLLFHMDGQTYSSKVVRLHR